jgi:hypothetical protein
MKVVCYLSLIQMAHCFNLSSVEEITVGTTNATSEKKSITSRSFWTIIVGGMLTGMGNGSVFGATLMCLLGRGGFERWGGEYFSAYDPSTFTGFIDWAMIVFGFAFCVILVVGLGRHDKLERAAG